MTENPASFPVPAGITPPITPYTVKGYSFGQRVRSRVFLWARHLGDDIVADPGTPVRAIGAGKVVWAEMRLGEKDRPNWGGIVILGHRHKDTDEPFYSLYGHLKNLRVKNDELVSAGQTLGEVAPGHTPENGYWKIPHVHFAIYVGPWVDQILPGYIRLFEGRTRFHWWQAPGEFIKGYNQKT